MKYLYLILLTTISGNVFASSSSSPSGASPISAYYQPNKLFDQTDVLEDPEYHPYLQAKGVNLDFLPPKEQNCFEEDSDSVTISIHSNDLEMSHCARAFEAALESSYWKNRRWLYTRAIAQEVLSIILLAAPILIGYWIAETFGSPTASSLLLTTAFLATVYSTNTLRMLLAAAFFPSNDPFVPYERTYAKRKLALSIMDAQIDQDRHFLGFENNRAEEAFLTARLGVYNPRTSFALLETLKLVPTESQIIHFKAQDLKNKLALYDDTQIHQILGVCLNHQALYQPQWGINHHGREFLFLISPPGHGKTYCVEQMAQSMGIKVISIDLSGIQPTDLFGTATQPGRLLEAIIQYPYRNGILFFDELCHVAKDPSLFATLLTILDPTKKSFYSPYLQRTIDLSHYLIVASGNEELSAKALKNRFNKERTVELIIQNKELFLDLLLDYGKRKLNKGNKVPSSWKQSLKESFKNRELSFREGEALIDQWIGKYRIQQLRPHLR